MLNKLRTVVGALSNFWYSFALQSRLVTVTSISVSLLMGSVTFWAVGSIQEDTYVYDNRFAKDISFLLSTSVVPFIESNNEIGLLNFSENFYTKTSTIRYILYLDKRNTLIFSIPFSSSEIPTSLLTNESLDYVGLFESSQKRFKNPSLTNLFIPLIDNNVFLGSFILGLNPNPTIITKSKLVRNFTTLVFFSISTMVSLNLIFNSLTITRPLKKLVVGVKNITAGNFIQQINLPFGGELGELITSFNMMGRRLQDYEQTNIERLASEKAKLETLVSTIADGAILLDTQLQIILVNPLAKNIFDGKGRSIVGKSILRYFPDELRESFFPIISQMLYSTEVSSFSINEFSFKLNRGKDKAICILLTMVFDQNRQDLKGFAMTIQDITKEFELNNVKNFFISNVSHELRTPLFNIKSFIETLKDYNETLTRKEKREFLEITSNETNRLARLVNNVLDLSKLESYQTYSFSNVDIGKTIMQVMSTYNLNMKDKNVLLVAEVEANLAHVNGNSDLLLQVISNLICNALKFTYSNGSIALRAYNIFQGNDNYARIEIIDTGIGINLEDQKYIFDRFLRVENQIHTLEGTGLGLSIVKAILQKHNSAIYLTSNPGVGSVLWFDLHYI